MTPNDSSPPCQQERAHAAQKLLNALAHDAVARLPDGWGVTFMAFPYGEGGTMVYLSTAERADMVRVLVEFIGHQLPLLTQEPPHGT